MKLKDRIKTYSFWVSLSSAIFLLLKLLGQQFNFRVDEGLFSDIFTTLCGILVILGIIAPPATKTEMPSIIALENSKELESDKQPITTILQEENNIEFTEIEEQIETAEDLNSEIQDEAQTEIEQSINEIEFNQANEQISDENAEIQTYEPAVEQTATNPDTQTETPDVQNIENSINVLFDTNNLSLDEKLNLLNTLKSKIENNN